jgi:hypothetical protein
MSSDDPPREDEDRPLIGVQIAIRAKLALDLEEGVAAQILVPLG